MTFRWAARTPQITAGKNMNDNIYGQELNRAIQSALGLWVVLAAMVFALITVAHAQPIRSDHCAQQQRPGASCNRWMALEPSVTSPAQRVPQEAPQATVPTSNHP
jgi:hypothetical protein